MQPSPSQLEALPFEPIQTDRFSKVYIPFWTICFSYFFCFLTFNLVQGLAATVHGNNGTVAIALLYVFFMCSNLIVSSILPWLFNNNPSLMIFTASLFYTMFAMANISMSAPVLIIAACVAGLAGGPCWIGWGANVSSLARYITEQDYIDELRSKYLLLNNNDINKANNEIIQLGYLYGNTTRLNTKKLTVQERYRLEKMIAQNNGWLFTVNFCFLSLNTMVGAFISYILLPAKIDDSPDIIWQLRVLFSVFSIISILANCIYFLNYRLSNPDMFLNTDKPAAKLDKLVPQDSTVQTIVQEIDKAIFSQNNNNNEYQQQVDSNNVIIAGSTLDDLQMGGSHIRHTTMNTSNNTSTTLPGLSSYRSGPLRDNNNNNNTTTTSTLAATTLTMLPTIEQEPPLPPSLSYSLSHGSVLPKRQQPHHTHTPIIATEPSGIAGIPTVTLDDHHNRPHNTIIQTGAATTATTTTTTLSMASSEISTTASIASSVQSESENILIQGNDQPLSVLQNLKQSLIFLSRTSLSRSCLLHALPWITQTIAINFALASFTSNAVKTTIDTKSVSIVIMIISFVDTATALLSAPFLKSRQLAQIYQTIGSLISLLGFIMVLLFPYSLWATSEEAWRFVVPIAIIFGISDAFIQAGSNGFVGILAEVNSYVKSSIMGVAQLYKTAGSILFFSMASLVPYIGQVRICIGLICISTLLQIMHVMVFKPINPDEIMGVTRRQPATQRLKRVFSKSSKKGTGKNTGKYQQYNDDNKDDPITAQNTRANANSTTYHINTNNNSAIALQDMNLSSNLRHANKHSLSVTDYNNSRQPVGADINNANDITLDLDLPTQQPQQHHHNNNNINDNDTYMMSDAPAGHFRPGHSLPSGGAGYVSTSSANQFNDL